MAARMQRPPEGREVAVAIGDIDHEVKDSAIVPEVEAATKVVVANVGLNPCHSVGILAKVGFGSVKRLARDVGDSDVAMAELQQLGGKAGRAATHVDNRGIGREAGLCDQLQRHHWHSLGPAQVAHAPLRIGSLPVAGAAGWHRTRL